jgi:hypothetical protein
VKSTEVYKLIHASVGPWCKANGFKRGKSGWLAYQKPVDGKYLSFWFQCDKWGWDKYSGSSLTVEFQFHASRELGQLSNQRLAQFLTSAELEAIRTHQNRIIGKIPPPPQEWVELFERNAQKRDDPASLMQGFWIPWRQIEQPYEPNHDIWLRYWEADDVKMWAEMVLGVLLRITEEVERAGRGRLSSSR